MARGIFGRAREAPPPQRKASAAGRVMAMASMGRIAWSPRDAASLTKAGFTDNPIGFRSVKLIAEAAAALPLACQDCEKRYETHPVLDLLRRPNPAQGRAELLEALYGQLLLTGDGYLEAVGEGGLPVELHVLRSDRMSVVPDREGWPAGFEYAVGGKRVRFPAEAVCHVRSFHPQDDHHGLSPMQAAAAAVDVHNAAVNGGANAGQRAAQNQAIRWSAVRDGGNGNHGGARALWVAGAGRGAASRRGRPRAVRSVTAETYPPQKCRTKSPQF